MEILQGLGRITLLLLHPLMRRLLNQIVKKKVKKKITLSKRLQDVLDKRPMTLVSVEDPSDSGVTNRSKYRARNSVGGNLARDTERRDPRLAYNQPAEAGRCQVQHMVTIPPPNFYLKNISPDKVMTFLRQWREYCLKYDTYVNPLTVVHQSFRDPFLEADPIDSIP
jgi:hypothetical protein